MFDGLTTASNLFEIFMISKFEEVKNMHIILLVCTLVAGALFVWKVFRPYVVHLHLQSKAAAGMLSQLPAEVDIEGPVRTFVLGWAKEVSADRSRQQKYQESAVPLGIEAANVHLRLDRQYSLPMSYRVFGLTDHPQSRRPLLEVTGR